MLSLKKTFGWLSISRNLSKNNLFGTKILPWLFEQVGRREGSLVSDSTSHRKQYPVDLSVVCGTSLTLTFKYSSHDKLHRKVESNFINYRCKNYYQQGIAC